MDGMNKWRSETGASLLTVMVAIGIGGIVFTWAMQHMLNMMNTQKHYEIRSDYIALHNYVRRKLDCPITLPSYPPACNSSGFIAVKTTDGGTTKTLIAIPSGSLYSKVGDYSLRAKCIPCPSCTNGKRILVEAAKLNSSGFRKDPLTGKPIDWRDLFEDIPLGCIVPAP